MCWSHILEGNKPLRWDRTRQVVERLENKQYLIKHDGSGRVLLRTRGHLKKIKPSTRSSVWPKMDQVELHQEEPEEVPLHIPGGMAAGRVLHPEHGHKEMHQEGGEGIRQGGAGGAGQGFSGTGSRGSGTGSGTGGDPG